MEKERPKNLDELHQSDERKKNVQVSTIQQGKQTTGI